MHCLSVFIGLGRASEPLSPDSASLTRVIVETVSLAGAASQLFDGNGLDIPGFPEACNEACQPLQETIKVRLTDRCEG